MKSHYKTVGVIGGGAWGTALAQSLSIAGRDVLLWARDPNVVDSINKRHTNDSRLPGFTLASNIQATGDIAEAASRDLIVFAVPAQHMREVGKLLGPHVARDAASVMCTKGYERDTQNTMVGVIMQTAKLKPAVLSGPSFAADVARGLPVAVTLAAETYGEATRLANAFSHRHFRVYVSTDIVGVQMGGAVKNVLAIAAGIVMGRKLGASAHAALINRAFYEISEFGRHVGTQRDTINGLSCLGDLILTCNSPQSRNFTLGRHLGEGRTLQEALKLTGGTAEGVYTAGAVIERARRGKRPIEMPITSAVHGIVNGTLTVNDAIDDLLSRPEKPEN